MSDLERFTQPGPESYMRAAKFCRAWGKEAYLLALCAPSILQEAEEEYLELCELIVALRLWYLMSSRRIVIMILHALTGVVVVLSKKMIQTPTTKISFLPSFNTTRSCPSRPRFNTSEGPLLAILRIFISARYAAHLHHIGR